VETFFCKSLRLEKNIQIHSFSHFFTTCRWFTL